MRTAIYPNRKGSRVARTASGVSSVLAVVALLAIVYCLPNGALAAYVPALLGGSVALFLLAALFRVLGCIAFDLETIAATKEVDYCEDGDDDDD